jgi:hypothetical protein
MKNLWVKFRACIAEKPIAIFPVAAVNQTEIKITPDGKARRVPASFFTSNGLDALNQWLVDTVLADLQRSEKEKADIEKQEKKEKFLKNVEKVLAYTCAAVILAIAAILITSILYSVLEPKIFPDAGSNNISEQPYYAIKDFLPDFTAVTRL